MILTFLFLSVLWSRENGIAKQKSWKFDFGETHTEKGFISIDNKFSYNRESGYGWKSFPDHVRDRNSPDALRRDFIYSNNPGVFRINIKSGTYKLSFIMGEIQYDDHFLKISIPSSGIDFPVLNPRKGEYITLTAAFKIEQEFIDITFDSPQNNWIINALEIEPCSRPREINISKEKFKVNIPIQDMWQDVKSWHDPMAPYLERFRKNLDSISDFKPSGLSRNDYLEVIRGNVDYFKTLQDENGAIIDPYKNIEWQYATPCFALAAATLVVHKERKDLLESAAKAMDWSCLTLSQRKAASRHEDFFSPQIAHALPLLRPLVDPERYANWGKNIRKFNPYETYRAAPGGGNWNVVALSGEGLFFLLGLRESKEYIENCLGGQGRFFNSPFGLYTEGPMPYDHFPRLWAADMLALGFKGKNTDKLEEVLRRGAITSLFMQSPTGELPAGGRSAHHQWNEAEQCVTYEIYAAKAKNAGDLVMAGVYKRAAHLSLGSMKRWIRPSGEMWIVKNKLDPSLAHGYEGYSSHSQYNLLAMAMLSIAHQHAKSTEDIPEKPAPADVGGFVFSLPKPHNKVFANAKDMYIEIDYAADLNHNATGLLRIHKKGFTPQLGPSDAITNKAIYHVPEMPPMSAAVGVSWKDKQGKWRSLAEFGRCHHREKFDYTPEVNLQIIEEKPELVKFQLIYTHDFHGPSRIIEKYTVTPDRVKQETELPDYNGDVRLVLPLLADNGQDKTNIRIDKDTIYVRLGKDTQSYKVPGAKSLKVQEEKYAFRNGWARLAIADFDKNSEPVLFIEPFSQKD